MFDVDDFKKDVDFQSASIIADMEKMMEEKAYPEAKVIDVERKVVALNRFIEKRCRELEVYKNSLYYARAIKEAGIVLSFFNTHDQITTVDDEFNRLTPVYGIISGAKFAVKAYYLHYTPAIDVRFHGIKSVLQSYILIEIIELYEDMYLLSESIITGNINQTEIERNLHDVKFDKVVDFLSTAKERLAKPNVTQNDLKDCLGNCRQALDQLVIDLMKKEGMTPGTHFHTNLMNFSDAHQDILPRTKADMVQSVANMLSMSGSHPYGTVDKEIGDHEFAITQTYNMISMILNAYSKRR